MHEYELIQNIARLQAKRLKRRAEQDAVQKARTECAAALAARWCATFGQGDQN